MLIFTVLNILETFDSSVKGHRTKCLKISWSYEVMNQSVDLLRWQGPKSFFFEARIWTRLSARFLWLGSSKKFPTRLKLAAHCLVGMAQSV